MNGYLGEEVVEDHKYYTPVDWALLFIEMYGSIDGKDHQTWLSDQIVRILCDTPIIVKVAKWDNGETENRFSLGSPSQRYIDWVIEYKDGEDGPETYNYDTGIAP